MSRMKRLIEDWFPIETVGCESMRERGASSALPPLYFLHVWWARRPLTASRAAMLASILPAWSDEVARFGRKRGLFGSEEEYRDWFMKLCGIYGDPVAGRAQLARAREAGRRIPNPYTHDRAFTVDPAPENLEVLGELLHLVRGRQRLTLLDPFAGGGSIPFEALRYGFDTRAVELNPVAGTILRGTLDYPFAFGPSLTYDLHRYGAILSQGLQERLKPYFSSVGDDTRLVGLAYLWARTVRCPYTGKPIPLAPNWWLQRSGSTGLAVRPIFDVRSATARFEIVEVDGVGPDGFDPANGTVKRGKGRSPWAADQAVSGDYIKTEAQSGCMGSQLYCVALKKARGGFDFRAPTEVDRKAVAQAEKVLARRLPGWDACGWVPREDIPTGNKTDEPQRYGMFTWADMFSPRQLLALCSYVEALHELVPQIEKELPEDRAKAVVTYLGMVLSKAVNYNSYLASWHSGRTVMRGVFDRHDYAFKWTYGEFDASRNLYPWCLDQVCDAYDGIAKLAEPAHRVFERARAAVPVQVTQTSASDLSHIPDGSVDVVLTDPPYYDNVMYGELSDFFYVWLKRTVGCVHPDLFGDDLANKDDEAVANPARFARLGRKKRQLASGDYERKMAAAFRETHRVLSGDGVLTVMFTHKKVEAWDTPGDVAAGGWLRHRLVLARPHRERTLAPPGEEERGEEHNPPDLPQATGRSGARMVGRHSWTGAPDRPRNGRGASGAGHLRGRPLHRDVRAHAGHSLQELARAHVRLRRRDRRAQAATARRRLGSGSQRGRQAAETAAPRAADAIRSGHRLVSHGVGCVQGRRVPSRRGPEARLGTGSRSGAGSRRATANAQEEGCQRAAPVPLRAARARPGGPRFRRVRGVDRRRAHGHAPVLGRRGTRRRSLPQEERLHSRPDLQVAAPGTCQRSSAGQEERQARPSGGPPPRWPPSGFLRRHRGPTGSGTDGGAGDFSAVMRSR